MSITRWLSEYEQYIVFIIAYARASLELSYWGYDKKRYTPLFRRQKGAHLENVWTIYNTVVEFGVESKPFVDRRQLLL